MKTIKYYELCRNFETKELEPVEYTGTLEKFFDSLTGKTINIVLRHSENGYWKATHLESGLNVATERIRKEVIEKVKSLIPSVITILNNERSHVHKYIAMLEEKKNNQLQGIMSKPIEI